MISKIDVLISVCGKPFQTALALLSLERTCGHIIDNIYFVEENTSLRGVDCGDHSFILNKLSHKIIHFTPKYWNYCFSIDFERINEIDYRDSLRYQYGWERSDKNFILIIHNDIVFHKDVVTPMINSIGDNVASGHIGQCWYCPAAFTHKCSPEKYMEYRPNFDELLSMYKRVQAPEGLFKRAYHLPRLHDMFLRQPWPLPECRVNEWCCLVNMKIARKLTIPHGRVIPFGAIVNVGKQILDVGCQWFREMHARGHTCQNFPIYDYVDHDVPPSGQATLIDDARYAAKELSALDDLRREYNFP